MKMVDLSGLSDGDSIYCPRTDCHPAQPSYIRTGAFNPHAANALRSPARSDQNYLVTTPTKALTLFLEDPHIPWRVNTRKMDNPS